MEQEPAPRPWEPGHPEHWDLLSDSDKASYSSLRNALSSSALKHRRYRASQISLSVVAMIRTFVAQQDGDDWKRALVCGICWLDGAVAINTHQLRLLIGKSKSSVNAMFQSLGYASLPTTADIGVKLAMAIPLIKDRFTEMRKWTVRAPPRGAELGAAARDRAIMF
jgi:hypothetical protein